MLAPSFNFFCYIPVYEISVDISLFYKIFKIVNKYICRIATQLRMPGISNIFNIIYTFLLDYFWGVNPPNPRRFIFRNL